MLIRLRTEFGTAEYTRLFADRPPAVAPIPRMNLSDRVKSGNIIVLGRLTARDRPSACGSWLGGYLAGKVADVIVAKVVEDSSRPISGVYAMSVIAIAALSTPVPDRAQRRPVPDSAASSSSDHWINQGGKEFKTISGISFSGYWRGQ